VLVENRNDLIASAMITHADGHAERDAALLIRKRVIFPSGTATRSVLEVGVRLF